MTCDSAHSTDHADACWSANATCDVDCPEHLVFGASRPLSDGSSPVSCATSYSSLTPSSCDDEPPLLGCGRDEKLRKNAEAAARYRQKKRLTTQGALQRCEELEKSQTRLQQDNDKLRAINLSLQSQLSSLMDLFRSSLQHPTPGILPTIHDMASPHDNDLEPVCDDNDIELLPSGSKRKSLACHAVVLLMVLSVGCEDLLECSQPPSQSTFADASAHRAGRALLWLDATDADSSQCSSSPHVFMGLPATGLSLQLASPLSSADTTTALLTLRGLSMVGILVHLGLARMLCSALAQILCVRRNEEHGIWRTWWQRRKTTEISVQRLWRWSGGHYASILPSYFVKCHTH